MYRRAFLLPATPDLKRDIDRSPDLFLDSLDDGKQFIFQSALVALSSLFESHVFCWCLNYLLAGLESGVLLDKKALDLLATISRKPHQFKAPTALSTFPTIWAGMGA